LHLSFAEGSAGRTVSRRYLERLLIGAILVVFSCSFALAWFLHPSSVGIGDWDWVFSDAYLSVRALLERGWLPLWSIQMSGGAPLAGNPESLSYSPFLLIPLTLGPILGTKVLVVLLIAAGVVGCYRLGLRWIEDSLGSTVFAFVFVFSGHFAIHLRAGHFPWAMFYLIPWILLFADRLLVDSTPRPGASVGLLVCLLLVFSGPVYHPVVFFLIPVSLIYGVVNCRNIELGRARHVLLLVLCAVLLTMPRWLAVIDWQRRSPRDVPEHGGMPFLSIGEMLLTPIEDYKTRTAWGGSGIWEYWSYVGIVSGILSLVGAVSAQVRGRSLAVRCIGMAALLSWGPWGSGLEWFASYIPFLSSVRVYSRFLVLAVFGIALLAGCGIRMLRSKMQGRFVWLPLLLSLAIVGEYWVVVRPIWGRIFALLPAEEYQDWGTTLEGAPYTAIRSAPVVQKFTDKQENFNSRMLPLLMAGAIVRNSYTALNGVYWLPIREGQVVEGLPESQYRLRNHELEFWGAFFPGDEIKIRLRCKKSYWKVADRSTARIYGDSGGTTLVILRPCNYVRISVRSGLEIGGWIVSGLGIVITAAVLWRERSALFVA
jgi:hypothetical protein